MNRFRVFWLPVLGLLAACGGPAATTGKLEVSLSGNPSGTAPVVRLTGGGQVNRPISGTLELTPGDYTIAAPALGETPTEHTYRATVSFPGGSSALNQATGKVVAGQTTKVEVRYAVTTGFVPISINVPTGQTKPAVSYVLKGSTQAPTVVGEGNLKLEAGIYVFTPGALSGYLVSPASVERTVVAGQTAESVSFAYAQGFGQLNLNISAPSGPTPSVRITGPNSYSNTVSTAQVLQLPPGQYTLTPSPVTAEGITYSAGAASNVSVGVGATASATVTYAATNSSIHVTLNGLQSGDLPTITLRRTDGTGTPQVQNPTGNTASFTALPFASYELSVSATRGAFNTLGAPAQTIVTSAANPLHRPVFTLTLRTGGQMVVGGNGNLLGANALYAVPTADLTSSLTVLGGPFVPLAVTQYTTTPALEAYNACYDSIARSPSKMVFDAQGNLYITYTGKSVSVSSGCPAVYYNYATPTLRSIYLDAFILKVSPENLASRRFYTIATRTEVGQPNPGTPLTREGTTRTIEYAVPAAGNQVILKSAAPTSPQSYLEDFTPANVEPGVEVTDLTFDAAGNMWFVNKESGLLACIAAAQLNSTNAEIRYANARYANAYFDADNVRTTKPAGVDPLLYNAFRNPGALAFDRDGNLWFTSDGWLYGGSNFSRLSRLDSAALACPQTMATADPAIQTVAPTVRLNISLNASARAFFEPTDLVLSPDGNALWVSDGGANDDVVLPIANRSLCPRRATDLVVGGVTSTTEVACSVGADREEESIIQVPIRNADGTPHANAVPNGTTPLRTAVVADRINLGSYHLQQPMAMSFDPSGRLWVATNNNMNVTQALVDASAETVPQYFQPRSLFRDALRDRRGKLYGITLPTTVSSNPAQPRAVASPITVSADTNVGLTGLGLYLPSR